VVLRTESKLSEERIYSTRAGRNTCFAQIAHLSTERDLYGQPQFLEKARGWEARKREDEEERG